MEYNFQRFYDRLDESFEIHDDAKLPAGSYWYTRQEIQANTFSGRRLSFDMETSWGGYYTGKRLEFSLETTLNFNKHCNLGFDYSYNRLHFPEGAFATHEFGRRTEYAFTTKLYTSLFGQWNNEDE